MIQIVDFKPEHLEQLDLRDHHKLEMSKYGITTYALTFLLGNTPIAIFGAFCVLEGVVQFWGLVSDQVKKCPIAFTKACRLFIDFYRDKYQLRRVQMTVRCDYPMGARWAKALGFQPEGIMRAYGLDRSDYALFGRVF